MLSAWRLFIAILILWKIFEYFYIFAGSHAESDLFIGIAYFNFNGKEATINRALDGSTYPG
jgi:hypothetical protein